MPKRILYQTDHELLVLEVKTIIQKIHIKNEVEFNNYLSNDSKTPIYWLVDTVKEEYQMTVLPHVLGKDRNDLIRYKKKRLFQETSYSYAVVQDREQQGRKDDQVLFIALSDPEFLQPWLNLILAYKVPLVGIYSVPLLSQQLFTQLPKTAYTLLITDTQPTHSHPGSIRQSFFRKQKLQFSRLIPLHVSEPEEHANYLLKQITTTQHFLENNRLLPENETLSIIILTSIDKCKACEIVNSNTVNLNINLIDSRILANKFNINNSDLSLQNFIATIFVRGRQVNHYAKLADRTYLIHRRGRLVMYFIASLILIGTIITAGFFVQDAIKINTKGQNFLTKANNLQVELQQLRTKELPNLPFRSELIVSIVDVGLRLQAKHISPKAALVKFSNVLNLHQRLSLNKLEWEVANSPNEAFNSNIKEFTESDFQPKKYFIEGIRVYGEIADFTNYKDVLHIFKKFVQDLKQYWQVKVLQQPYNPNSKLQGRSAETKAPFIIEIFIPHNYPHASD
ncbi:MAG TPA: hypothetical protein ENK59_04025 [Thioploca sp.]|nr:hypothetical protein [Thioploca sp.]